MSLVPLRPNKRRPLCFSSNGLCLEREHADENDTNVLNAPPTAVSTPLPDRTLPCVSDDEEIVESPRKRPRISSPIQVRCELVDPEGDVTRASRFEILVLSHVVVSPEGCLQCRLCPSGHRFHCESAADLGTQLPNLKQHLLECSESPHWLKRLLGKLSASTTRAYLDLVYKRLQARRKMENVP